MRNPIPKENWLAKSPCELAVIRTGSQLYQEHLVLCRERESPNGILSEEPASVPMS